MLLDRVAPELRKPAQRASFLPIARPFGRAVLRALMRAMPAAKVDGATVEVRRDAGAGVGARIYRPAVVRSAGALLWIHGGGFIIGRAVQNDRFCGEAAAALGIVVVSAEYRKAPEAPFPAGLDDCHAVWLWLQREAAAFGIDASWITVGGESAGGGLAASLVQRLHDEGGRQPAAQWLFCPMLDDRTASRRELDAVGHFVWTNRLNLVGWRSYLGVEPGTFALPVYAAAARRLDLAGLPPAWIGVGDIDLFCEEDLAYADRLRAAGVATETDVVPGAPHGFEIWAADSALARAHIERAHRWLAGVLEADITAGTG